MMTDPICLRSTASSPTVARSAWTVHVRRVTRSMAFFAPARRTASSERHGVLTEDTDDAIGFRLSLSLPCTTPRGVVE
jgi:hypothetical protein